MLVEYTQVDAVMAFPQCRSSTLVLVLFSYDVLITAQSLQMPLPYAFMILLHLVTTGRSAHHRRQAQCPSSRAVRQAWSSWPSSTLRSPTVDGNVVPDRPGEIVDNVKCEGYQPR